MKILHAQKTSEDKLTAIKNTRKLVADSLLGTLKKINFRDGSVSEKYFCDMWLKTIRKHSTIFPDGWYINPPNGMAVLSGTPTQDSRINYTNLRIESLWPKSNVFLGGKNEMLYVYFSPVDRKTGMIGDFGMTIYLGKNPKVIRHLQRCLSIDLEIFEHIKVGMSFSEIYRFAGTLFKKYRLTNSVLSITDPSKMNIGHTVPASYEDWTPLEKILLQKGETKWSTIVNLISKKRKFISAVENQQIQAGMAITVEPRLIELKNSIIPLSSYHTIVLIKEDGTKQLLTNFEEIFTFTGMEYML